MVKTSVARDEKRKTSLDETVIVSMEHVNKWFGEFHVLRDINLRVVRGNGSWCADHLVLANRHSSGV